MITLLLKVPYTKGTLRPRWFYYVLIQSIIDNLAVIANNGVVNKGGGLGADLVKNGRFYR